MPAPLPRNTRRYLCPAAAVPLSNRVVAGILRIVNIAHAGGTFETRLHSDPHGRPAAAEAMVPDSLG